MGYQGEVRAVAGFQEDGHTGDKAEHGARVVGVNDADDNKQGARDDAQEVNPELLDPETGPPLEQDIGDDATKRASDHIQKTEHCSPLSRGGLVELREVLPVIPAQNGVDGQLSTEGIEIAERQDKGLRCKHNSDRLLEGGPHDDFPLSRVHHLLLGQLSFVIAERRNFA